MPVDVPVTPNLRAVVMFLYHTSVWKSILNVYLLVLNLHNNVCEVSSIIILLVRKLKFPEVRVTCPRSPCWYVACLTLHQPVSKHALSTSYVLTDPGDIFVIFTLLYSFLWSVGWTLAKTNTSVNNFDSLGCTKIAMDHYLHGAYI